MNNPQYGGALSGVQLYKFFNYMYNEKDKLPENFVPLNKNNLKLYNSKLKVFYNPKNIHIVVAHRGTKLDDNRDVFNNVRNFISVKNEYLITYRNLIAKEGHNELKNYLVKVYNNRVKYYLKYKTIIDYIDKLIKNSKELTVKNAVDKLLKSKLSTIGYSQGAVYAYLYGEHGKETLVYNPAPYFHKKPKNTYVVKTKIDPVSVLNSSEKIHIIKKRNKTYKELKSIKTYEEAHSLKHLKNITKKFGNKSLSTNSKKNRQSIKKNRQSIKNTTRKIK
jgi:hypothetical protein